MSLEQSLDLPVLQSVFVEQFSLWLQVTVSCFFACPVILLLDLRYCKLSIVDDLILYSSEECWTGFDRQS